MVNNLDLVFNALADPTRREMLEQIAKKAATVTELAAPHQMSLPAISKHLKVLENANLIIRLKHGREHTFQLNTEPLYHAQKYISFYAQFWGARFDL